MKNPGGHIVSLIILAVFTLYFTHDIYTFKKFLWHPDIATYYYPFRQWFVNRLMNGEFPTWNPYWGLGQPIEAWASIPLDLYTPLEMIFGASYNYFFILELALILSSAYYAFIKFGITPATAAAGAIIFFLTPWVSYFYFYFLLGHSFIGNLLLFVFVYQWFNTENYKYLFYMVGAFIIGMMGTKLEFWFNNTAMFVFYVLIAAILFYTGRIKHTRKLVAFALGAMVIGILTQIWQLNMLLRVFKYSKRAVNHSLLNILSLEMYQNLFMSLLESTLWKMIILGFLLYFFTIVKKRFLSALLMVATGLVALQIPPLFVFIKSPVSIGVCVGIALSSTISENRDWRTQVRTASLFLLFVFYWCRPERGDLGEMIPIRSAPMTFKILLASLVWLGCTRTLKSKLAQMAWLSVAIIFLMREQGQIILSYITGMLWIPTRDNYTIDWGTAVIATLGLAQIQYVGKDLNTFLRHTALPASIAICIAVFASLSNPYYMHPSMRETVPGYPYYQGMKPVRQLVRDLRDSPTWRAFFYDPQRNRGHTWGFGAFLLENASQVTMYTSVAAKNYRDWSLYRRSGIMPENNWGSYTAEYSEKTMKYLPKMNTLGLANDDIFNYIVEAKPPLEKSALQLLGVTHVIMANPPNEDMMSKLETRNIRKHESKFIGQLYSPEPTAQDGFYVAEIEDPLPRAFLAYGVSPENQHEFQNEMKPQIKNNVLMTPTANFQYVPVQIDSYEPEKVSLTVDTREVANLVLLDLDHPFWHARIDGNEIEINPAFFLFRNIKVPQGKHKVDFYCEIPYLFECIKFSVLAVVLTLCVFLFLLRRRAFFDKTMPNKNRIQTHA